MRDIVVKLVDDPTASESHPFPLAVAKIADQHSHMKEDVFNCQALELVTLNIRRL